MILEGLGGRGRECTAHNRIWPMAIRVEGRDEGVGFRPRQKPVKTGFGCRMYGLVLTVFWEAGFQ